MCATPTAPSRSTATDGRGCDVILCDPDGVEVLEVGDDEFVNGVLVKDFDQGQRSWRRESAYSMFADGETDVAAALQRLRLVLTLEVEGESAADLRANRDAVLAAAEVPGWILDVGDGIQFRCEVADSVSPRRNGAPSTLSRELTLFIPAQPIYGL